MLRISSASRASAKALEDVDVARPFVRLVDGQLARGELEEDRLVVQDEEAGTGGRTAQVGTEQVLLILNRVVVERLQPEGRLPPGAERGDERSPVHRPLLGRGPAEQARVDLDEGP
jgi:hypothetical protein